MIFLSTDPREGPCRQVLEKHLGKTDAMTLVRWLWERHHETKEPSFGDALQAVTMQTEAKGVEFARNLLDASRKPKHVFETELAVSQWLKERTEKACAIVRRFGGAQDAAKAEFDMLLVDLIKFLRGLYPRVHAATMRGAILTGLSHSNGGFDYNAATIVEALEMKDPLAVNAAASWAG